MAFKLFGVGGPGPKAQNDLKRLLSLDEGRLAVLAEWVNTTENLYPETLSAFGGLIERLNLTGQEATNIVNVVRYLLTSWSSKNITIGDILEDLQQMGFEDEERDKASFLLRQIAASKDRVHRAALKRLYEQMALPTADDINMTWDYRPIFEDVAYSTASSPNAYEDLTGGVCVFLLEVLASRTDGQLESKTYQFSEDGFERLVTGLTRARRQLELLKKRVS